MKLTIIIPAYNEAETIAQTVLALKQLKGSLEGFGIDQFSIIVVDDGSRDLTNDEAVKAGADQVIRHKLNQGLGAAVRSGLKTALQLGSDIVVKFDADLQHTPLDIIKLIKPIIKDEADIVYGNRFNRIRYTMPFVRRVGNRFFTSLMCFLTGYPLKDSQPGILAVNKDYLNCFRILGDYNYTQQILLDGHYNNMRFAHVDVAFNKRVTGKSFVSLKYPFKVFYQILMLIVSAKPFQIFAPIGFISLLIAFLISGVQISLWLKGLSEKPIMNVNAVTGLLIVGLQSLSFGLLAQLIVNLNKK